MSLKQSVVIVNEYTIKTPDGGSRGGTPGQYVRRYMARDLATETITPVRLHEVDSYIERYMVRESAVETAKGVQNLKNMMYQAQKQGGVAFGYGDAALSHEKLLKASRDIQQQFDKGKTVFKTILSFDEDFLKEHGLVDSGLVIRNKGDYRGHLDQMKLRLAVMNGLSKLSREYDDLRYVGVIQVDTKHVHVHLAMVDAGKGTLMPDGTQRGKITEKGKQLLRRGVDEFLDRKQTVKQMCSNILYDKQNALCYIKKFTHQEMNRQGLPQFLLACLPEDRTLWRAGCHAKEMKKANMLVRDYVVTVLSHPGSGYADAVRHITEYADYRKHREGLSQDMYDRLVRTGQETLLEDCMNSVYRILKDVPQESLSIHTPMLSAMSMDYEQMAAEAVNDPMVEFGFRLRSYSSRANHHRKEYHKFRDEHREYEAAEDKSEDSKPLGDYLLLESQYQRMLLSKYLHFLLFLPPGEDTEEMFRELRAEEAEIERLSQMYADEELRQMDEAAAEQYGLDTYGEYGGRRLRTMPQILERRISQKQERYQERLGVFQDSLADYGMYYDGTGIVRKDVYAFTDVKALDLHHMDYDFPYDFRISKGNVDAFCEMANRRYAAFLDAKEYLMASGQEAAVSVLPEKDVKAMKELADQLASDGVLHSRRPLSSGGKRFARTISLDTSYLDEMQSAVTKEVSSLSDFGG